MPIAAIMSAIAMIEQFLPAAAGSASKIGTIISFIETILPLVQKIGGALYRGFKNITSTLAADPATTAEQLVRLKEIDRISDAAYDAADVPQPGDPDYVAPTS